MRNRFADTKIAPDGRRVPASDIEEPEGPVRSTVIDPDTQIAADGTRVPVDQVEDDHDRNAESLFREARGAEIEAGVNPPANGLGIMNDVETVEASEPVESSDDEPEQTDPESDDDTDEVDEMTKAELLELAADLEIEGRSGMNKAELHDAVKAAQE